MVRRNGMRGCSRLKLLALLLAAIVLLFCGCTATPDGPSAAPVETAASTGTTVPETAATTRTAVPETAAPTGSAVPETEEARPQPASSTEASTEKTEEPGMKLRINETEIEVLWEDNESVSALRELAKHAPLTIQMSPYGGFEQVGPIGQSIPRNDVQTVTEPGDLVLYSGNQIVVFYGSNSWAYTRLGKIRSLNPSSLTELLGSGAVTLTISFEG